ncbi:alpha/beta fold hydrolase [Streptosporangium lutulentum]|uniref:Pimeloyl-ACP methyl ester carboxylesterase n=1 Tax=Streptosporangium lutulentum TaxID=1461250 RepID=A0ABT9Q6U9_9ACTN|nr:alpha/beta hydrolase [Streptosporangium lutulentum]MDP9842485.1 pimeloyl-ACP methyl ester carboxylesterase [Streptosporangium lutulentum]
MPHVVVGSENGAEVSLYYEDAGAGDPVVLIHGWPLSRRSWDSQVQTFVEAGHRVITYDRRGFGRSTHAWDGYDLDTFTADLHTLVEHLGLTRVSLVGFSSGGGEVARYAATFGTDRLHRIVLAGPVIGADRQMAADLTIASRRHRISMLDDLLTRFFSVDGESALDEPTRRYLLQAAADASAKAVTDSIGAWSNAEPLADLIRIDVPTLVVHGEQDAFMPYEAGGRQVAAAIAGSATVLIPSAPHGVPITHHEQWNQAVLAFLND